jgi:transcriptional regulator with XRE-family HTH domain
MRVIIQQMNDNRFKALRLALGLKQKEVAEKLGIQRPAVSKWEIGLTLPDQSILPRLAKLYNTTIEYLLTGEIAEEQEIPEIWELYNELSENSKIVISNSIRQQTNY